MKKVITEEEFIERLHWLIKLRWIAVFGVVLAVTFSNRILKFSLPLTPLYAVAAAIGAYNLAFLFFVIRIGKKISNNRFKITNTVTNLQISFDLFSLAFLIHFSGGVENPFIFYFVFHTIIASVLLSRRAAFLQATLAIALFSIIVVLEYLGILPHYCLIRFVTIDQHRNLIYILGIYFVFVSTLYIAAYMATSIVKRLRAHQRQLRQANELLEEKDRIKSEYVLRVTHDIKEHLSSIEGCLQPVSAGITGVLNDSQRDLLERAEQRVDKLMFFVKALLEITRIKLSKHIEMDYFSLRKTVESAVNFVDAKAKNKSIRINCEIEPSIEKIKGAQVYIEETIANLLSNSVKYTAAHGKIGISVKDRGDTVLIQITDTGIGVPKSDIPYIFNEFYRASNAKGIERTGTGLGLSIAKQVVERHNGKIWVESEVGRGSTFSIELPKQGG